jgi:hypothetical protein
MAYAVQPQVIEGMAENPVFRGRGLVGRFCYAIPKSLIGRRKIDPEPVKDETRRDYENLIRRLYEIFEKRSASDAPVVLKLATDAMSAFLAFREDVERRLGDGAELELMRDWGGKLCGLAARFAAIIHLVSNNRPEPWRDPVSLSTVRAAVDLANYAVPHAAAVIDLMTVESDEATADGEYLAQWIQSRELAEFTQAAAYQHGRARFTKDQTRLAKALELLAKHGWVRLRPDTEKDGPGRKPSPVYEVNPAVLPPSKKPQGEKDGSEPQNIQGVI